MWLFSSCHAPSEPIHHITEADLLHNKLTRICELSPTIRSLWKAAEEKFKTPIVVHFVPDEFVLSGVRGRWEFDMYQPAANIRMPTLRIAAIDGVEPLITALFYLHDVQNLTILGKRAYYHNISHLDFIKETCPNQGEVAKHVKQVCLELFPAFEYEPSSKLMTYHAVRMSQTWQDYQTLPAQPKLET